MYTPPVTSWELATPEASEPTVRRQLSKVGLVTGTKSSDLQVGVATCRRDLAEKSDCIGGSLSEVIPREVEKGVGDSQKQATI